MTNKIEIKINVLILLSIAIKDKMVQWELRVSRVKDLCQWTMAWISKIKMANKVQTI